MSPHSLSTEKKCIPLNMWMVKNALFFREKEGGDIMWLVMLLPHPKIELLPQPQKQEEYKVPT